GPASIPMLSASISRQEMEKALAAPPNALQIGLAEMADHLPSGAAGIPPHVAALRSMAVQPAPPRPATTGEALDRARAGMARFMPPR
ncbi:MAG TPA: hypothetical protein VFN77_10330, partial [Acetobacteraceae bacterium]|nr:hypothetical protein [Acetobacteraceae bacterium]